MGLLAVLPNENTAFSAGLLAGNAGGAAFVFTFPNKLFSLGFSKTAEPNINGLEGSTVAGFPKSSILAGGSPPFVVGVASNRTFFVSKELSSLFSVLFPNREASGFSVVLFKKEVASAPKRGLGDSFTSGLGTTVDSAGFTRGPFVVPKLKLGAEETGATVEGELIVDLNEKVEVGEEARLGVGFNRDDDGVLGELAVD